MSIQNSKFFKLFSVLPTKQQEAFIDYTKNKHFCNSHKVRAFVALFTTAPFQIDKKIIFNKIYPDKRYEDIHLRMILSKTYQLLSSFVAIEEIQANKMGAYEWQMKAALKLQQIDYADDILKNWKKELTTLPKFSDAFFLEQKKYAEFAHLHQASQMSAKKRVAQLDFQLLNQSTDHYFITQKLKHFINQLNYQSMVKSDKQLSFYSQIENQINNEDNLPKAMPIYYGITQLYLQFENQDNFYQLKELISDNIFHFEKTEGRELYLHLQNFCIRKINKGDPSFLQTLYDIYFEMIKNQTIYENGILSQWTYKNVVSAGLRLNDYDGVENFIQEQNEKIETKYQETAFAFNQANLLFSKKKYDKSIVLLQSIHSSDIFYLLGSKVLLAKAYFELDEADALQSLIESFKKLLTRKKLLTPRHILTHNNFLKILKKILACTSSKAPALLITIEKTENVAERNWLLSKVKELG